MLTKSQHPNEKRYAYILCHNSGLGPIHFDSRILVREVNQIFFFDLWFTWANHFIFWFWFILIHFRCERIALIHFAWLWFWFWFTLIHNSFGFLFTSICDSIWFYSFWFGLILIRRESWFCHKFWFTCESKIKSNQK